VVKGKWEHDGYSDGYAEGYNTTCLRWAEIKNLQFMRISINIVM